MNNADNNKVTIDAAWFAELYATAKQYDVAARTVASLAKERDELKAKLAAAERCIEEVWVELGTIHRSSERQLVAIENIIRAYREQKEAK